MITLVVHSNNLSQHIVSPSGLIVIDSPSSYEVPLALKTAPLSLSLCTVHAHAWHGGKSWRKTKIDSYTLLSVWHMQKSYVWIIFY